MAAASDKPIKRDNHFVPRGLMRRWSANDRTLYAYRLLVSHSDVPTWEEKSIRSVAKRRDLYTTLDGTNESDAIEERFAREIETPGLEASHRLIGGTRLSRDEWHSVVRFYALQELRTPQSFVEAMARDGKWMPGLLENTLDRTMTVWKSASAERRRELAEPTAGNAFSDLFDFEIRRNDDPAMGGALEISVVLGRRYWLATIQHHLRDGGRALDKLLRYQWCVLTPARGFEWPLTDHPTLRVSHNAGQLSFQGGVGKRGALLAMPLSPNHLLFCRIGNRQRGFVEASEQDTRALRSLLVRRAWRSVFAPRPLQWVEKERPRRVSQEDFESEEAQWERWHEEQSATERGANAE